MLKKIAIFCGGPSSEHEVSLSSAKTIAKFIDLEKYEVYYFFISKENKCKLTIFNGSTDFSKLKPNTPLVEGLRDIKKKKIFAFLAGIHGQFGEDGSLQVLLEHFSIPYSGSRSASSSLCMDKMRSMLIVKNLKGIEIPKTTLYNSAFEKIPEVDYPVFVKPNTLGSSVGVFEVKNYNQLKEAVGFIKNELKENEILIQEHIGGIEYSCGVLQDKNGKIKLLPPIEIHPKKASTFDYASKYEEGGSEEITPPISISEKQSHKLSEITMQIHDLLGCKTYSRSDFKIRKGKIYYLETNTLPGMTTTSLLPQEAAAVGIKFDKLLDFLIENSNDSNS